MYFSYLTSGKRAISLLDEFKVAASGHKYPERDVLIANLIVDRGLRPAEISNLRVGGLLKNKNEFLAGKSAAIVRSNLELDEGRLVPLSRAAKWAIINTCGYIRNEFWTPGSDWDELPLAFSRSAVGHSSKLMAMTPDGVSDLFARLASEVGSPKLTAQEARKWAILRRAKRVLKRINDGKPNNGLADVQEFAGLKEARQVTAILLKLQFTKSRIRKLELASQKNSRFENSRPAQRVTN